MRIKIIIIASFASAVLLLVPFNTFAASASTVATAKSSLIYSAFIPFWQAKAGAQDISAHLTSFKELSPFSYDVSSNGTLIDDLNIGDGSWNGWFQPVHELGIKIIPTISWFDGNAIYNVLSNTAKRQAEENTFTALAKAQNFNGIDVDFEDMVAATKPYYTLFIEGLALRLHPLGKTVTCDLNAITPASSLYGGVPSDAAFTEDYTALSKYCDEIRIMAYDQETIDTTLDAEKGNGNLYAPVADPAWTEAVIQQTLQLVSPSKVMLGIPTYGYEYEVSWQGGITTYQRVRAFDFFDAMDRADSLGITPVRDNADELSFTYASTTYIQESPALISTVFSAEPAVLMNPNPNATTTFFVSFPDSQTIQDEINLAKKYDLKGVILFKADGDIDPATWGELQ